MTAPKAPVKTKVHVARVIDAGVLMSAEAFGKTEMAARFAPGDRVLLHGHACGQPTGRARLCRNDGGRWVSTWAWSRGAEDPARILEPLSLEPAQNTVDKSG